MTRRNRECAYCGKDTLKRVFCSEECRKKLEAIAREGDTSIRKYGPLYDYYAKHCVICESKFKPDRNRKTCSKECSWQLTLQNHPSLRKRLSQQQKS